ncbi:MAG: hypothetical protein ACYTFI_28820, partial [Planctomycetota bacterium]
MAVVGDFAGSATFGQGEANATSLTSSGTSDIFVACYGPGGALAWAKKVGGTGDDYGGDVAALPWDSVVVTGSFESDATFGYGGGNETTLASAGSIDVFVAEYAHDGRLAWAKRAGGDDSDAGISVAVRSDGSAVVAGLYRTTAVFGPDEEGETTFSSDGFSDAFLAAYAVCPAPPYERGTATPFGGGCTPGSGGGPLSLLPPLVLALSALRRRGGRVRSSRVGGTIAVALGALLLVGCAGTCGSAVVPARPAMPGTPTGASHGLAFAPFASVPAGLLQAPGDSATPSPGEAPIVTVPRAEPMPSTPPVLPAGVRIGAFIPAAADVDGYSGSAMLGAYYRGLLRPAFGHGPIPFEIGLDLAWSDSDDGRVDSGFYALRFDCLFSGWPN